MVMALEKRLEALERSQANAGLEGMADAELDARLETLEAGSPRWFQVVLERIWRKGSRLPLATFAKSGQT